MYIVHETVQLNHPLKVSQHVFRNVVPGALPPPPPTYLLEVTAAFQFHKA